MTRKMLGVHACWLDKECRSHGVPAFTYFNCWWFTIRINPPRDRLADIYEGQRHWHWQIIQIWRNR